MYRGRLVPGDNSDGISARPAESYRNRPAPGLDHGNIAATGIKASTGGAKRIACVLVADFAVSAIARANPELRERPFALIRMPTPRRSNSNSNGSSARKPADYQPHSELSQVSPTARAAGLRPEMTVAQARALMPGLIVTHPSPAAERSAADALLDAAESISPVAEAGAPGCVWIDLSGLGRLYRHSAGSDDPAGEIENSIAEELLKRTRRLGLEVSVGVGSNKKLAHLAARCGGVRVIAPGMEREFLDWLPLDLLQFDGNGGGDELEMLKRLGIRRLGDIGRLDIHAVGSRLGARGVELARLARGEGSATVIARRRAEIFAEAAEFEYGIENLEPLDFMLHAMLGQLTERLSMRGLAGGDMTLSLGLGDRRRDDRQVPVAAATTEARALLTLLKLSLEKLPPAAAVESVRLTIEARTPGLTQNDLFLPPTPAPDRLETAIARIAALCGPERVGTLLPADSHRPEAVRLGKFAPPPPAASRPSGRDLSHSPQAAEPAVSNTAPMVLRTIRPAEEIEVMCTRSTPEFVRGQNICARVVSAAGPWRRQGEWWSSAAKPVARTEANSFHAHAPAAYARDYYELALADGAVYRMYFDFASGKWFADGIYD
ncbi:MAG TPA: DNA polymerase Y family protein [Candidatus Binataceae bacterium]|nr:DNA polymerase Y family protein [Candidatus Binataceae bacterium]